MNLRPLSALSRRLAALAALACPLALAAQEAPRRPSLSGIHPHLAAYNDEGECGTGAVVPWAGRLWVITYGPHCVYGSSDRLYEIAPDLVRTVRPESVGGTHANRMIHRESDQLFIGLHAIDARGRVRTIPWKAMPGRLTGTARHLTDPARKVYMATMEEGLYEVDVHTLEVRELIRDGNVDPKKRPDLQLPAAALRSRLPGYHGKGLFTGQGRLLYANNGEQDPRARTDPTLPSGALAEWTGEGDWRLVRRNQFCEVRGPGDLHGGNPDPAGDPVWSLGWDHRSLILMLLDGGAWYVYRLPKGSHSYDGAHGWNTEWPRIRDIGEPDFLATMHGTFWRFPRDFRRRRSAGIAPRSNYLKVVGDFCRWGDKVVLGCDDSAKSEFINTRPFKNPQAAPGQSNSNLWFLDPARLDHLGPALGRGAVWLREDVPAGTPSDPYLFSGYARRMIWLAHETDHAVPFALEVDRRGEDRWELLRTLEVPARGAAFHVFSPEETGAWVRVRPARDVAGASVGFQYSAADPRPAEPDPVFVGLGRAGSGEVCGGILWAPGGNRGVLSLAAVRVRPGGGVEDLGYYELDAELRLRRREDPAALERVRKAAPPPDPVQVDAASVLAVEDGRRWRLPLHPGGNVPVPFSPPRVCREVVTERDLFHVQGTFYELPARNAGGLARIRPIATHPFGIHDYASFRGLLVMTGVEAGAAGTGGHVIRSEDGRAAVWAGAIDDLWGLGKPRGVGGPWKDTPVEPGVPSDPYLMTGYDRKTLALSHTGGETVTFTVEVDPEGTGLWCPYGTFAVGPGKTEMHRFPEGFSAYWVRLRADRAVRATAWFVYE